MKHTHVLKKNHAFTRVYRKGCYKSSPTVSLHVLKRRGRMTRLGVTCSRKVRGSVRRNRLKRLLREAYRIFDGQVKKGYDIVLVARASESMPTFQQICRDVELVLQKARLLLDDSDAIPKQTDQRLSVDRICHEAQADVQPSKELVTDAPNS